MINKIEDIKLTLSEIHLARTVLNIAMCRDMNAGIESKADIVKLEKIQEQIKECNLGRDIALTVESYLLNLGCREYGKNLRFDISYRSDTRTLSICHVGHYTDENENPGEVKVSYAQPSTHHTSASLDNLAAPRNLVRNSIVLRDDLQNELKQWLRYPIRLPNGKEVYTIRSKHFDIQFFNNREGVCLGLTTVLKAD